MSITQKQKAHLIDISDFFLSKSKILVFVFLEMDKKYQSAKGLYFFLDIINNIHDQTRLHAARKILTI